MLVLLREGDLDIVLREQLNDTKADITASRPHIARISPAYRPHIASSLRIDPDVTIKYQSAVTEVIKIHQIE